MSAAGIGPLRVGITADSLRRVCRIVSSHEVREYEHTIHRVRIGSDTVRAFEREKRIAWIEVESPGFRTPDSLGVGSNANAILHLPDVTGGAGDGTNTFVLYPRSGAHCGLSFWLDATTAEMINRTRGDQLRLLGMRGAGVIVQVDIHGQCGGRRPL